MSYLYGMWQMLSLTQHVAGVVTNLTQHVAGVKNFNMWQMLVLFISIFYNYVYLCFFYCYLYTYYYGIYNSYYLLHKDGPINLENCPLSFHLGHTNGRNTVDHYGDI